MDERRCMFMLLYLTTRTWKGIEASEALEMEVLRAKGRGIQIILVHEWPSVDDLPPFEPPALPSTVVPAGAPPTPGCCLADASMSTHSALGQASMSAHSALGQASTSAHSGLGQNSASLKSMVSSNSSASTKSCLTLGSRGSAGRLLSPISSRLSGLGSPGSRASAGAWISEQVSTVATQIASVATTRGRRPSSSPNQTSSQMTSQQPSSQRDSINITKRSAGRDRHACEFDDFFLHTPSTLLKPATNIYRVRAITLTGGAARPTSLLGLVQALASKMREATFLAIEQDAVKLFYAMLASSRSVGQSGSSTSREATRSRRSRGSYLARVPSAPWMKSSKSFSHKCSQMDPHSSALESGRRESGSASRKDSGDSATTPPDSGRSAERSPQAGTSARCEEDAPQTTNAASPPSCNGADGYHTPSACEPQTPYGRLAQLAWLTSQEGKRSAATSAATSEGRPSIECASAVSEGPDSRDSSFTSV